MKLIVLVVPVLLAGSVGLAATQESPRTPLPATHPLVGAWRLELPDLGCIEQYEFRADGTKLSRSGKELSESEFEIVPVGSSTSHYKWVDRVTKSNGEADCTGAVTSVGHVTVNFIRVHSSGQRLLVCDAESTDSCYAELHRKPK